MQVVDQQSGHPPRVTPPSGGVGQTSVMPAEPEPDRLGCTDCERLRDGRIAQPVNTVTSAAFVAAALPVLVGAMRQRDHRLEQGAYAALLALVGAGSIAFHGPQPRGAKQLHDWPIVGLAAVTIGTPLVRTVRRRPPLPGLVGRRGLSLAVTGTAAALAWYGGRTGARTCHPDSPFQLHGCWHVLAALGFAQAARVLYGSSEGR